MSFAKAASVVTVASTVPATAYLAPPLSANSAERSALSGFHTQATPAWSAPSVQSSQSLACGLAGLAAASVAVVAVKKQIRSAKGASKRKKILTKAFENELGVQAPVGFWDPLGFTTDGDAEAFRRRRETELKHGRVSMIACIGYIVPEYFRWPGLCSVSKGLSFDDIPAGLKAITTLPAGGWTQIVLFAGLLEVAYFEQDPERAPGDFKNGGILGVPNGTSLPDGEAKTRKLNVELANGRLAMMAIIGMFFQDGLTGSAWGDWALYTDSPLRAFENELGVQAPVGFWDPVGLASDGDAVAFRRRRETELKHGRVSMWACLGYIVPEFVRWPGFCSPSKELAFADIPAGLGALAKVPGAGWTQMILFAGFLETSVFKQEPGRSPGDFKAGGVLGVPNGSTLPDGEAKARKLNAELANGRLAMMAIIGMFYQDGLTGSAWGDWSLYTDSPLRARGGDAAAAPAFDPASMPGATEPLGFWDPAGFCADKNEETFMSLRGAELKHGRVAMLANAGFLLQPFLKFKELDVKDGALALDYTGDSAILGCAFLFVGLFELKILPALEGDKPGDFGDPFKISSGSALNYDQAQAKNAELNNGRLAMIGAIGAITANLYTGLDSYEQWGAAKGAAIAFVKTTIWWAA